MARISADDLDKQQLGKLVEFLTGRLRTQFVQHGSTIDLESLTARETKFLLRKFLYSNGLNDYRVLNHDDVLEVVHVKQTKEQEERPEGLKPSMPGPIAGIPHTVKPSETVEWSEHPWQRKSSRKDR